MTKTHNLEMSNENIRIVAHLMKNGWRMETVMLQYGEEFLLMRKGNNGRKIPILKRMTTEQN